MGYRFVQFLNDDFLYTVRQVTAKHPGKLCNKCCNQHCNCAATITEKITDNGFMGGQSPEHLKGPRSHLYRVFWQNDGIEPLVLLVYRSQVSAFVLHVVMPA